MTELDQMKLIMANDPQWTQLLNECEKNGFIGQDGNLTPESAEAIRGFKPFVAQLAANTTRRYMIKIEGPDITPEKATFGLLRYITESVEAIAAKARAGFPRLRIEELPLAIRSGSIEVEVEIPTRFDEDGSSAIVDEVSGILGGISQTVAKEYAIEDANAGIVKPIAGILSFPGVTNVVIGFDEQRKKIVRDKQPMLKAGIDSYNKLKRAKEAENFKGQVLIFEANNEQLSFMAYSSKDGARLTFKIPGSKEESLWWVVKDRLTKFVKDTPIAEYKGRFVTVEGKFRSKSVIEVESLAIH